MNWRQAALWIAGLGMLAGAASAPGARPNLELPWILTHAGGSLLLLAAHLMMRRRGLIESALAVALALAWSAGPRPGLSSLLAVAGLGAATAAYFAFKLESRMHEDQEITREGRARTHEAVSFASRRILVVCTLAAAVAWGLLHLPTATASWVSPRWSVSVDAASPGVAGAVVGVFLLVIAGWRLVRLGRANTEVDR